MVLCNLDGSASCVLGNPTRFVFNLIEWVLFDFPVLSLFCVFTLDFFGPSLIVGGGGNRCGQIFHIVSNDDLTQTVHVVNDSKGSENQSDGLEGCHAPIE